MENLIYAGAFDSLYATDTSHLTNRAQLIAALPEFIAAVQSFKSNKGQSSLFGDEDIIIESPPLPQVPDYELFERLEMLLTDGNAECAALVKDIRNVPGTEELVGHIEHYNFKDALQALVKIMKK